MSDQPDGKQPSSFERIRLIVAQTFPSIKADAVERSTTSADVDGWDSLSYSVLIMNVETAFEVELPIDQIFELANVGELADLVESIESPS